MFPLHQSIKSEVSEHCFIMRFGGRPFNMEGVSMFFSKTGNCFDTKQKYFCMYNRLILFKLEDHTITLLHLSRHDIFSIKVDNISFTNKKTYPTP
jgi:hypothetical protein